MVPWLKFVSEGSISGGRRSQRGQTICRKDVCSPDQDRLAAVNHWFISRKAWQHRVHWIQSDWGEGRRCYWMFIWRGLVKALSGHTKGQGILKGLGQSKSLITKKLPKKQAFITSCLPYLPYLMGANICTWKEMFTHQKFFWFDSLFQGRKYQTSEWLCWSHIANVCHLDWMRGYREKQALPSGHGHDMKPLNSQYGHSINVLDGHD